MMTAVRPAACADISSGRWTSNARKAMDDVAVLAERTGWTVAGPVETYEPVPGGWRAQVRYLTVPGRTYARWFVVIIDPHGRAHFTTSYSSLGEAVGVAEGTVGGWNAERRALARPGRRSADLTLVSFGSCRLTSVTTESFGYSAANPAHAAFQIIRGQSAFVAAMTVARRRSMVFVPGPPEVTSAGLEVAKTFTIQERRNWLTGYSFTSC